MPLQGKDLSSQEIVVFSTYIFSIHCDNDNNVLLLFVQGCGSVEILPNHSVSALCLYCSVHGREDEE